MYKLLSVYKLFERIPAPVESFSKLDLRPRKPHERVLVPALTGAVAATAH